MIDLLSKFCVLCGLLFGARFLFSNSETLVIFRRFVHWVRSLLGATAKLFLLLSDWVCKGALGLGDGFRLALYIEVCTLALNVFVEEFLLCAINMAFAGCLAGF